MKCEKCQKEHTGTFGSGKFCSRSCANSRTFSKQARVKKSIINKKYFKENPDKIRRGFKCPLHQKEILKQKCKERIINKTFYPFWNHAPSGNSHLRKNEKLMKPKLEQFFNTTNLFPQKIGKHWFDLVNKKFIIEHSNDYGFGITNAINRFKTIKNDKRIKYLIAPNKNFGIIRKQRLYETGAKFIPLEKII